jgi:hypothetical protein
MISVDQDLENADWLKPSKSADRDQQDESFEAAAIEAPAPNGNAAEFKEDSEG